MNVTPCLGCDPIPSSTARPLVGWVLENPGRGTLSLILTCLFTSFLCTWVMLHPRVYKRPLFRRLHKIALFLKTIVAPESIAVEGFQEWKSALKMRKNCAELTGGHFKLLHAFYINMLALRYRTSRGERVLWPNQYTWLLEQRLIVWDDHALWGLSEENIRDKSNADGTTKLLALVQVLWFFAQGMVRLAHDLPLSQLELMTASYIPLFAVTYPFWWFKPKDIENPSVVDLPHMLPHQKTTFESMTVSSAFDDEGTRAQASLWSIWYLTPRVFDKEAEDKAIEEARQKASQEVERKTTLRKTQKRTILKETKQPSTLPDVDSERAMEEHDKGSPSMITPANVSPSKERVVAYWGTLIYHPKLFWPITLVLGLLSGVFLLTGWTAEFPTRIEQLLWRTATLTSI
ncbi:MAG: 3-methyladenine DNA glycosylase, partial [Chaenotheca gracillima]